ncbi:glycosyltransferase family 4 protein [Priestia aryabhattai]|uniref:glycosyltransferase family 4 protein n=1 Tax=Priestia aryabhattai TaxID=412384 RepID=UPI001FB3F8B5|nr:glycosyltransferase family 4 protein [Priestia aryabhattai]MED4000959.1 glycosyltransferase family 4 protein [Priestia aryabhattai]
MKVLHICVCGPVTDGWNYQENMLTKYHSKFGHDVTLLAPQWAWGTNGKVEKNKSSNYRNQDGVQIIRLPIIGKKEIFNSFKRYIGFYNVIEEISPDIIFVHNIQFIDIVNIVKYARKSSVKIYVDNHADFSNSARTLMAKIFYKVVWRFLAKKIEPFIEKFYGVLPSRVDFIKAMYRVNPEKVELLVMGADDDEVLKASDLRIKRLLREKHKINENDFLIVTGGKIDEFKMQTLLLMQAVKRIDNKNVKLLVFGSVADNLKEKLYSLCDGEKIQYIGWVNAADSYKYFAIADLVVFPGRHSIFWEQVVGQGIPMICKYWDGSSHIDLGGNVEFIYQDTVDSIYCKIMDVIMTPNKIIEMKKVAEKEGMKYFSYKNISERSILQ